MERLMYADLYSWKQLVSFIVNLELKFQFADQIFVLSSIWRSDFKFEDQIFVFFVLS